MWFRRVRFSFSPFLISVLEERVLITMAELVIRQSLWERLPAELQREVLSWASIVQVVRLWKAWPDWREWLSGEFSFWLQRQAVGVPLSSFELELETFLFVTRHVSCEFCQCTE